MGSIPTRRRIRVVGALVVLVLCMGFLAGCEPPPALLRGQITHSGNGTHPSGVRVRVYSTTTQVLVAETVTDAEGRFRFTESDLEAGTYRIRFSDGAWWQNASSWSSATDLTVNSEAATVINPSILPAVGTLSGTVNDGEGPVGDATVEAISTVSGTGVASTTTDPSGAYAFASLPTGQYRIKATAGGLAPAYSPSSPTAAGATIVAVAANQAISDVHVGLTLPASLAGIVSANGVPRGGVTAVAMTPGAHEIPGVAVTDEDGRFEITGLPATGYLLSLSDSTGDLGTVVAGATPDDPDSGIVYPLSAGGRLDAGTIDIAEGGAAAPTILTGELPEAVVGMPVQIPLEAIGGAGGYTWHVSGLPDGLQVDAEASIITGTPTAPGEAPLELVLTDARGQTATRTLALDVQVGMPDGCIVQDCALVDPASQTVELAPGAVGSVLRDLEGTLTSLTLTATAPAVIAGQVLVVPPGDNVPDGVIVEVTAVEASGDGQIVEVIAASITDAYESALIKSSDATVTLVPDTEAAPPAAGARAVAPTAPAHAADTQAAAAGTSCALEAKVEVAPDVGIDVDPYLSVLYGRNWFGFGNVFVGTGGLKMIHAQVDTELTVGVSGNITGSVACEVDIPDAVARIPLGHAGFASFRLAPELGLSATASATVDAQVRLHCSMAYHWNEGQTSRYQWCRPISSGPTITGLGAEVTLSGSINATATYNELVGISGQIDASLRARYQPRNNPRGDLAAKVTATVSGCGVCFFGNDAPSFTLAEGTLYGEPLQGGGVGHRTFTTWGYEPVAPPADPPPGTGCAELADTVWNGTMAWPDGSGSTSPASALFDSNGMLTSYFGINAQDVSVDCDSISFNLVGIADFQGTFDPTHRSVSGTWGYVGQPADGTWSAVRDIAPTCPALANTSWEGTWQTGSFSGTWRGTFDAEGEGGAFEITETGLGITLRDEYPSQGEVDCESITFLFDPLSWTFAGDFNAARTSVSGTIAGSESGTWTGNRSSPDHSRAMR